MPAGSNFLIEKGMLGDCLHNETISDAQPTDYYWFEVRNHGLHAVHPLGWIRKLTLAVDGTTIPDDQYYFVLRGQWIRADHVSTITDIYWYLCEAARIYVCKQGGIGGGKHAISLGIATSRLDQTSLLDVKSIWPLREQTICAEMCLEEG